MLSYLLQFSFFMFVFWGAYELFFKKETFYNYNRAYLLLTPIISGILPFLGVPFLANYGIEAQQIAQLPAVFVGEPVGETILETHKETTSSAVGFWEENAILLTYLFGIFISSLLFLRKLFQFHQLKKLGKRILKENFILIEVPNSKIACTFFKTIYLGEDLSLEGKEQILKHEKVHAQQYHTLDLLFFEILKILVWFNPIVYFYQKHVTNLHEYIADAAATKNSDKRKYYESLLSMAFGNHQIKFINQFFNHSLIKKRIVMLQKSKSAKTAKLKFFILIPLILGMLTYVSCSENVIRETPAHDEITDTNMKDQLWKELKEMEANNADYFDISDEFMIKHIDNHIYSKEDYYRTLTFLRWNLENAKTRDIKNGIYDSEEEKELYKFLDQTYAEYVAFKRTSEEESTVATEIVPFTAIETIPVYPGCENLETEAAKKCMSENIRDFVNTNFNTKKVEPFAKKGINRIYVRFAINKNGEIDNVEARNFIPELVTEAERVVAQLPKMKPGEMDGKPVSVLYSLPIIFKIDE